MNRPTELFERLRNKARTGVVLEALAWLVLAGIAFVVLSLLLDRSLRLEWGYRAAILAGFAATCLWLVWRRLWQPLQTKLGDDEMALAIERSQPELHQQLISATQFERVLASGQPTRESGELMRTVVETTRAKAASLRAELALDRKRQVRALSAIAVGVLGLAIGTVLATSTMRLWFARNVLLRNVDWPRRTNLQFLDAPADTIRVAQGDDLVIRVQAEGALPDRAWLHVRFAGGDHGIEPMTQSGPGQFSFTLQSILEDAVLHARGGDGLTGELRLQMVERPILAEIDVVAHFPDYLAAPATKITDLTADLRLPRGSRLAVQARANKPLRSAFIVPNQGARIEARCAGDRLQVEFTPEQSGAVSLDVLDQDQLGCARPPRWFVRLIDDQAPAVAFKTIGIGPLITTHARIAGQLRAKDDHGLESVSATMRLQAGEAGPIQGDGATSQPAVLPFETAPFVGLDAFKAGTREFTGDIVFDLKPFSPDANPDSDKNRFKPGQQLVIKFSAKDRFGPNGPHVGESDLLTFRLVTREKLIEELQRRQLEQRRDLEQIIAQEKADRAQIAELVAPTAADPRAAQSKLRIQGITREQRGLGKRVYGVADRYGAILDEMSNNRLYEANQIQQMFDGICAPLVKLSQEEFPRSADLLGEYGTDGKDDQRAACLAAYNLIIRRLQQVLAQMHDVENLATLLESLRQVITVEDEVMADVERRLGGVLLQNPTTRPRKNSDNKPEEKK